MVGIWRQNKMETRMRFGSTEHVWQLSPSGRVDEKELKRVQITGTRGPNIFTCLCLSR